MPMNNKVEDIKYIRDHLEQKDELSGDELLKYVLYDLYLREKLDSNLASQMEQLEIPKTLTSNTTKEFNDILPKLQAYESAKADYFRGDKSENLVELARDMLRELIEFLRAIKVNADTQEERDLIEKSFRIISNI